MLEQIELFRTRIKAIGLDANKFFAINFSCTGTTCLIWEDELDPYLIMNSSIRFEFKKTLFNEFYFDLYKLTITVCKRP
jgi:hypothetical protein